MTVVSLTALHLKPGINWDDAQKTLKQGNDLVRKHGGENVTAMVTMAAGPEPVKRFETRSCHAFCARSCSGSLIQAMVGSFGGSGRRCRNRAGLAV